MLMPGRHYNADKYRFGFNGKEKDPEWNGGAVYDYYFIIYDSRIAKFLSVDPLTKSYPWYTPYQFAGNEPIWASDIDGLEPQIEIRGRSRTINGKVITDEQVYRELTRRYISVLKKYYIYKDEKTGLHKRDDQRIIYEATFIGEHEGMESASQFFERARELADIALNNDYFDALYFNGQKIHAETRKANEILRKQIEKELAWQNYLNACRNGKIEAYNQIITGGITVTLGSIDLATSVKDLGAHAFLDIMVIGYGADQFSGGITKLNKINESLKSGYMIFEADKKYEIIGGLIQEKFGQEGEIIYDLMGIGLSIYSGGANISKMSLSGSQLNNLLHAIGAGNDTYSVGNSVIKIKYD